MVDLGKFHLESETCTNIRKQMEELQKQRQQAASSTSYYGYLPNFATSAKSTTTKGSSVEQDDSDDEDDDEFITPASSPTASPPPIASPAGPNAGDTFAATKSPETSQDQSANKSDLETALSRKLYERFTISLSDMQVILGRNVFGLSLMS